MQLIFLSSNEKNVMNVLLPWYHTQYNVVQPKIVDNVDILVYTRVTYKLLETKYFIHSTAQTS